MRFMPELLSQQVLSRNGEMHPNEGNKIHYIVLVIVISKGLSLLLQCKENSSYYFQSLLPGLSTDVGT